MVTELKIKNMVCGRCIKVIQEEFQKLGLTIESISLGEVKIKEDISEQLNEITSLLQENGFELLEDNKAKLINKIKTIIINLIYSDKLEDNISFSELLEKEMNFNYKYLSSLFSSIMDITIEQFIILQKIERAKELIKYNELTLSEIAYKLGYSSVQYLSSQFKKVTGFTATEYKELKTNLRKPLDEIT